MAEQTSRLAGEGESPDQKFEDSILSAYEAWADADLMSYLYPRYGYGYRYQLSPERAAERKKDFEGHRKEVGELLDRLSEIIIEELVGGEDRTSAMRILSNVARGGRLKQLVRDDSYKDLILKVLGDLQQRLGDEEIAALLSETVSRDAFAVADEMDTGSGAARSEASSGRSDEIFQARDETRTGLGATLSLWLQKLAPSIRDTRAEIDTAEKQVFRLAGILAARRKG